jgi:DNA-binding response OmpR family regulator
VQSECRKIWDDLTVPEQDALVCMVSACGTADEAAMDSVVAKHVVIGDGPERHVFARAFGDFLARQQVARRTTRTGGLQVDVESGEVRLNDEPLPSLTNLEYRLLLLLYGRLGKIVSKYDVVEAVWGDEYIDEVDDARIEKLVSRLRQKVEPDINNPRFLQTIRGRGYKLVQA